MKKLLGFLMIAMFVFASTVFAEEKLNLRPEEKAYYNELGQAFIESKLPPRWEYVTTFGDGVDVVVFYDTKSVTQPYSDEFDVWACDFYRGKSPCNLVVCKEKNMQKEKHYHLHRWKYNVRKMTMTLLSTMVKDEKQNVIFSYDFPLHLQSENTINPESVAESLYNKVKDDLNKKKK